MEVSCFTMMSDTISGPNAKDELETFLDKLDDEKRQLKSYTYKLKKKIDTFSLQNLDPEEINDCLTDEDIKFFEDGPNLKMIKNSLSKIINTITAINESRKMQLELTNNAKELVDYFSSN